MESRQVALLIARVVFGGFFLFNAFNHFTRTTAMAGYAASKGVPLPTVAVLVAGVLLLVGGLSLLFGWAPRVGVICLLVFLIPVTLIMHAFWADPDPQARAIDLAMFAKNLGLIGGTMAFAAVPTPWPTSVDERVRAHRAAPQRPAEQT
ncbi:MAG: DoxX family protein [Myxococcaceae bacterium]|nr:DoxX family protein [Myxococcaceae bacterium]